MSRVDEALRRMGEGSLEREAAPDATVHGYPKEDPLAPDLSVGNDEEPDAGSEELLSRIASVDVRPSPPAAASPGQGSRRSRVAPPGIYGRLAVSLDDAYSQRGARTAMVTSAGRQEGKTVAALNLARVLSEYSTRRVLLIDADLEEPSLHDVIGVDNGIGLSEILYSKARALPVVEMSPLLCVAVAGRSAPAGEPTQSDKIEAMLKECLRHFHWVILDAPPVALHPDTRTLAGLTQAVVFVMSATSFLPDVEKAMADIGRARIVGTVLTGVDDDLTP